MQAAEEYARDCIIAGLGYGHSTATRLLTEARIEMTTENQRGTIQNVGGVIRRVPQGQGASAARPVVQAGQPSVSTGPLPATIRPSDGKLIDFDTKPPSAISYAPLAAPRRLSFMGTSFGFARDALARVFGDFPIRLGTEDARTIAGMIAAAGDGSTPFDEILSALQQHGELELRLEG